jgi:hypothetical protein
MTRRYSFEPFNILTPLASLLIDLGGSVPEFFNHRCVWFYAEVGGHSADVTFPVCDVIKPTKNYFLNMAALAAEVEKKLLEHANNHDLVPPMRAANNEHASASGACSGATLPGDRRLDRYLEGFDRYGS